MVDFTKGHGGEGLARKKTFDDTFWFVYAFCGGRGYGKCDPLILTDTKELCLHSQSGTVDFIGEQGVCQSSETCIVCTEHFALPPPKEFPICICCTKAIGEPKTEGTVVKGSVYESNAILKHDDMKWLVWAVCCGCSVHKPCAGENKIPFVGAQAKQFCCASTTQLEAISVDMGGQDVFCSTLGNTLCCWEECQLPPATGNPKCSICNWRMIKGSEGASTTVVGAVQQMDMSK